MPLVNTVVLVHYQSLEYQRGAGHSWGTPWRDLLAGRTDAWVPSSVHHPLPQITNSLVWQLSPLDMSHHQAWLPLVSYIACAPLLILEAHSVSVSMVMRRVSPFFNWTSTNVGTRQPSDFLPKNNFLVARVHSHIFSVFCPGRNEIDGALLSPSLLENEEVYEHSNIVLSGPISVSWPIITHWVHIVD